MSTHAGELRGLLGGPTVVAPGVFDGVSAAQARRAGARAVYVSGAGTAAARGVPDMSVLSATELVDAARVIVEASGLPAIVDIDTGYGGAVAIRRLLRALASVGVAAVQLEDQAFPRRCGYLTTERPVPADEMLRRLTAAAAAEVDVLIVARTDALLTDGLDAAIERAIAYRDGGADLVMVNGIRTIADLERIAEGLMFPQLYNMSGSDRSPFVALDQAADLGVAIIVYPIHIHRAAALAAERMLTDLVAGRPPEPDAMIGFEHYMDLAGWSEAASFEQSINPDAQESAP